MTYADAFNIRTKNVKFNDVADAIDGTLTRGYGGTTTGTSTAYLASPTPAWTAYDTSIAITIIPHVTNTGAATLNVSSLGAKAIKIGGADLPAGALVAGRPTILIYTGVHFEVTVAQNALLIDGSNAMIADLDFGGFKPSNVAAGTALLPAFCAGGDVNTGVFGPAADTWAVSTGGAERLRIDSGGGFALSGAASPGHFYSMTVPNGFSIASVGTRMRMRANAYYDGSNVVYATSDGASEVLLSSLADGISFLTAPSGTAGATATFTERMRITRDGLVGIGTTSPGEILHLRSSAPRIRMEDTDGGGVYATVSANSANGSVYLQADPTNGSANSIIGFDVDGSTRCIMNQYGLGVGVTPFINTLSAGIDFEDNAGLFGHNTSLYISANTYYNGGWLRKTTGYGSLYVVDASNGQHLWYTAGTAGANTGISYSLRMRLDNAGRLGIQTNPDASHTLTLNATAKIGGGGVSYPATASYIGASANTIGFAWASPHIYGAVDNVVNAIVGTVSDYRLKENFTPFNTALDRILQLEVGTYNPKEFSGEVSDKVHCGVLAHVAGEIFPDLMTGQKDQVSENGSPLYQSFNYAGLVPYLVVALKELKEQIRQLQEGQ